MKRRLLFLFAVFMVATSVGWGQTDLYVSTSGSDGNGGGVEAPLATIAKAIEKAADGATIRVAEGIYPQVSPIVIPKSITIIGSDSTNCIIEGQLDIQRDEEESVINVSVSAMTYSASQKRLLLLHKSIKKRIMVIENPNPISLEYPTLLEVLKKELAQDPKKSLVSFCEKHSINYDHFNRWLRTTGRSFTRLCNEVRLKTGLPQNSNELYLNSLGLLKTELDNDINLRFVDFCERHNISYRGMANWLAINNMDFFSIRAQICAAKGIEVPKGSRQPYIPHPSNGDKAQARFGKTLDTYRKELDSNPRYSLKVHCARMGTSYYDMLRWMRFMKVSVRQLQKAASLNAKIPRQSSMVMVQFRPNGGTRSDMFRGVTISCPDGKSIHVEECSVIELCTFLYTYDKDQRRK